MKVSHKKWAVLAIGILIALAVVALVFLRPAENKKHESKAQLKPLKEEPGLVVLEKFSIGKAGITTATLERTSPRIQLKGYATVLSAEPLSELRNNYTAAKASFDKAAALLGASRKEYERLKSLYEDNRNVSEKTLQVAEADLLSNEAELRAAKISLETVENDVKMKWGESLAKWIFGEMPGFKNLINIEDVLIKATLPPDQHPQSAPHRIYLISADGSHMQAKFLSMLSSTDPRIQGMNFLYVARSDKIRLIPGMNLEAFFPSGPKITGFVIPYAAVIWSEGKSWCYLETSPGRFERREVPTATSLENGYFVTGGFRSGDRIVTRGAQVLLSEELLPKGRSAGGKDED